MAVFCQRSSAGVDVWGPWFDQTGPRSAGGSIRVELSAVRVGLMAEKDWVYVIFVFRSVLMIMKLPTGARNIAVVTDCHD